MIRPVLSPPPPGRTRWAAPPAADDERRALDAAFALHHVAPAAIDHLLAQSRTVHCDAGPLPYASPRRPEPSWWLVTAGQVERGRTGEDGRWIGRRVLGPGEWLDIASALSRPGTWIERAICRTPASFLLVPVAALFEHGHGEGGLGEAAAAMLSDHIRELVGTGARSS